MGARPPANRRQGNSMFSDASTVVIALFLLAPILVGILFRVFSPRMRSVIDARMLTADEQVAFLEAAVMTLYIDGYLEKSEEIALRSFLKTKKWRIDVEKEIARIRPRALRALRNPMDLNAYMIGIKEKISSEEAAGSILLACTDLSDHGGPSGWIGESGFLISLERLLRADHEQGPN